MNNTCVTPTFPFRNDDSNLGCVRDRHLSSGENNGVEESFPFPRRGFLLERCGTKQRRSCDIRQGRSNICHANFSHLPAVFFFQKVAQRRRVTCDAIKVKINRCFVKHRACLKKTIPFITVLYDAQNIVYIRLSLSPVTLHASIHHISSNATG